MIGVILWKSASNSTAIIWCEDHGKLAYHKADGASASLSLVEIGDMVQFDLNEIGAMRRAGAMQVLERGAFGNLASQMAASGVAQNSAFSGEMADIIPLPSREPTQVRAVA